MDGGALRDLWTLEALDFLHSDSRTSWSLAWSIDCRKTRGWRKKILLIHLLHLELYNLLMCIWAVFTPWNPFVVVKLSLAYVSLVSFLYLEMHKNKDKCLLLYKVENHTRGYDYAFKIVFFQSILASWVRISRVQHSQKSEYVLGITLRQWGRLNSVYQTITILSQFLLLSLKSRFMKVTFVLFSFFCDLIPSLWLISPLECHIL